MHKSSKRELEDDSLFIGTLIANSWHCVFVLFADSSISSLFLFRLPSFLCIFSEDTKRLRSVQEFEDEEDIEFDFEFEDDMRDEAEGFPVSLFCLQFQFLCVSPTRTSHSVSELFLCFLPSYMLHCKSHCSFPSMPDPKGATPSYGNSRVILHVDIDCFYAQVRGKESMLRVKCLRFFPLHHRWKQILIPSCVGNRLGEFFYCRIVLSFSLLP